LLQNSRVTRFRYAQHCPLARACEIVGQRWTLLVVRDLLLGPKRFSDLLRPLAGVSTSVLADRLAQLEEQGLVRQRALPPPTPAVLYELTGSGRALLPVIVSLARWGARFLGPPRPGDHFEPDWLRLGFAAYARRSGSPALTVAVTLGEGESRVRFRVAGGPEGTVVLADEGPADVSIRAASALPLMALASGVLPAHEAVRGGEIQVEGDLAALERFPALFEVGGAADSEAGVLGTP
jgi:DNA-binding HxlR family transcriptional regulator